MTSCIGQRSRIGKGLLILLFTIVMILTPQVFTAFADTPQRPRIGLALGGGGALGFAHIGVLKVLEELRIPVDVIAGTSMGAIIVGLYASGMSPEDMQAALSEIDWWDILKDETPRQDLSFRRKRDRERYIGIEMGIKRSGIRLPAATSAGQKLTNLMQALTLNASQIENFDDLNIPYRAVATDIVSGDAVVLSDGNLAIAMRASMAVPGFFSPVEIDSRVLVDGMLVNNLPADVVRAMGADVVIAVDLGSGDEQTDKESPQSLLDVLGRTYAVMRRPVNEKQFKLADILILPALKGFSVASFHRAKEIVPKGRQGAEDLADRLLSLQVSKADFGAYLARQRRQVFEQQDTIAAIRITGNERVDTRIISDQIRSRPGGRLDLEQIDADLKKIHGLGDFEQVLFRLHRVGEDLYDVEYLVKEKSWGPLFLNFGLRLESDDDRNTSWHILFNLTRTQLNRLGAEWFTDLKVGEISGLFSEWYQPLRFDRRFFLAPSIDLSFETVDFFEDEERIAEYEVSLYQFNLDLGSQFRDFGEARAGLLIGYGDAKVKIGAEELPRVEEQLRAVRGRLTFDQLDRFVFPRKGYYLDLEGQFYRKFLGGERKYDKAQLTAEGFHTRGRHTMSARLRAGTSFDSEIPAYNQFRVGGASTAERDHFAFFGLAEGQLWGPYAGVFTLGYRYRLFKLSPVIGENVYAAVNWDTGNAWQIKDEIGFDDLRHGGSLVLMAETLLGPLVIGYGRADGGDSRFHFVLGGAF